MLHSDTDDEWKGSGDERESPWDEIETLKGAENPQIPWYLSQNPKCEINEFCEREGIEAFSTFKEHWMSNEDFKFQWNKNKVKRREQNTWVFSLQNQCSVVLVKPNLRGVDMYNFGSESECFMAYFEQLGLSVKRTKAGDMFILDNTIEEYRSQTMSSCGAVSGICNGLLQYHGHDYEVGNRCTSKKMLAIANKRIGRAAGNTEITGVCDVVEIAEAVAEAEGMEPVSKKRVYTFLCRRWPIAQSLDTAVYGILKSVKSYYDFDGKMRGASGDFDADIPSPSHCLYSVNTEPAGHQGFHWFTVSAQFEGKQK